MCDEPIGQPQNELQQAYQQALLYLRELAALYKTERAQREQLEAINEHFKLALQEAVARNPSDDGDPASELNELRAELEQAQRQNLAYAADLAKSYMGERARSRALAQTQEQLNRSEKLAALGQMVAAIAHDVNNMIGPINAYSQLMLLIPGMPENGRIYATRIQQAAHKSIAMLRSLTNFGASRIMKRSVVQLELIVYAAVGLLEHNLSQKQIKTVLDIDSNLPPIEADEGQLEQVLVNLMVNAQHAMEEHGGELRIQIRSSESEVRLSVSDQGHGIPPEILKQLFEPFFTTKEPGKGSGLGLFICHDIIERHGGTLDVESVVGVGTTFFVKLPVRKAPESEAPQALTPIP